MPDKAPTPPARQRSRPRPTRVPAARRGTRLALRLAALLGVAGLALGPLALAGAAAGDLTMNARMLLQGHARGGAWVAIEVDLQNDGPPIDGELQLSGSTQGGARYAVAVNLPTGSRQAYVLHAQPASFGTSLKLNLVAGGQVVDAATVAYTVHDANQLVVGVVAERPASVLSQIRLSPNTSGSPAALVPLSVADLPDRVDGWATLDRLVWQDVDSNALSSEQLDALRRWISGGGRLVIVGGSAGLATLSAFPDDLLPFRPTSTIDLDPSRLAGLLAELPDNATSVPAFSGDSGRGRALATSGDRVVAAELTVGSGRVTLLGFDPTAGWLADSRSVESLWRSVLPDRTFDGTSINDDSQLVQAVYQLPALALPPTVGLLALILTYIVVVGPINYLVLRRLDRRELAWVTMPVLVGGFAIAAFGYGAVLRGTDTVVNEVAIVRGAPDATEATAQVYFGVFSPSRGTYQVTVPAAALLAAPLNADVFGTGTASLDLVQGTGPERPSLVRDLLVGTGSIRVVRAQVPVDGPRIRATLSIVDGNLVGSVENGSTQRLENAAVALGGTVATLGTLEPGATAPVQVPLRFNPFGISLAELVIGPSFDVSTEAGVLRAARYQLLNQLTYDPFNGFSGVLSGDRAIVLAFGSDEILPIELGETTPRRYSNVLYEVPVPVEVRGHITFSGDLLSSTVVASDAQFFSKERVFLNMGVGTAEVAYRPLPFDGTFTVSDVRLALSNGEVLGPAAKGQAIAPLPGPIVDCLDDAGTEPEGCVARRFDFLPEVEVFDLETATWLRLERMNVGATYSLTDPSRYVDPATGQLLVRFVNPSPEGGVGFSFQVALEGTVQ